MKKSILIVLLSIFLAIPAQAYDDILRLVQEKQILGTLQSGNLAVILPYQLQESAFSLPAHYQKLKVGRYEQRANFPSSTPLNAKRYQIVNDPTSYLSLISVRDEQTNQVIKQISVGRRAQRLIANPSINRLYVLCGGYFGSIWEIDTTEDIVLRKLPVYDRQQSYTLWNPTDIALAPTGHTLLAASGTLHLIDLLSGRIKAEVKLPSHIRQVRQLFPISSHKMGVQTQTDDGKIQPFIFDLNTQAFTPIKHLGFPQLNPFAVSIKTPQRDEWRIRKLSYIASKNADYIYMLDLDNDEKVGIIPVDFAVDHLLLTNDQRYLFAYHGQFGQISIIDLMPNTPTRFSVIRRFQDPRFVSNPQNSYLLSQNADHVYLWDGYKQTIASISLKEQVTPIDLKQVKRTPPLYLRINIPFQIGLQKSSEKVWVSTPSRQRFFLKGNHLYVEPYAQVGQKKPDIPRPLLTENKGLTAIALSPDERHLYILDGANNQLKIMDVYDYQITKEITLGKNPRNLQVSPRGDRVFVLNADEASVATVSLNDGNVSVMSLDMGLDQPYVVKIYNQDERVTQLHNVEIPRYQKNATLMVK